jgi:uncharacterized membrane-anchored protein YjiN (DUF445 family)
MNKRQILASLNNIANTLDRSGFNREADTITKVMVKLAEEETESYGKEPAKKIIDDFVDQAKRNERYDPSILKMMNDRLEFNGHERMSEKKFKEMIGKNKEANSTNVMKRLAEMSSADFILELAIASIIRKARTKKFESLPKSFFNRNKKDDPRDYHEKAKSLQRQLYNLIQGTDFSENTQGLRSRLEQIAHENLDTFIFDIEDLRHLLSEYEFNLKKEENREKWKRGEPFNKALDSMEYPTRDDIE